MPREVSDKELTLQNTLANAGPRRNSSNTRHSISSSRRHSSNQMMDVDADENEPRLKWDEANLYSTELERDSKMKIDEPKTPYVKQYDPAEDEEEITALDANNIVVDELEKAHGRKSSGAGTSKDTIPDLSLGEPEESFENDQSDGERRVIVEPLNDNANHGEEPAESMSSEEQRKHREFEERRKRHYEMHNVKDMLG